MSTDAAPTDIGIKWSNRYAVKVSHQSLVLLLSEFPWHSCWACMYSCWTAFETSQHILRIALTKHQLGEKIGLLLIPRFCIWSLTDNHVERIIWLYQAKCIIWCFSEIHSTRCSNYTEYLFPVLKFLLQLLQVLQKYCRLWKYFMKGEMFPFVNTDCMLMFQYVNTDSICIKYWLFDKILKFWFW